ncbi:hypothetical protein HYX14_01620 [Candidatus Woesearchaeota archaeon]|nr:hypothetical protein [Candidatus Woesearchaeota archaeon]
MKLYFRSVSDYVSKRFDAFATLAETQKEMERQLNKLSGFKPADLDKSSKLYAHAQFVKKILQNSTVVETENGLKVKAYLNEDSTKNSYHLELEEESGFLEILNRVKCIYDALPNDQEHYLEVASRRPYQIKDGVKNATEKIENTGGMTELPPGFTLLPKKAKIRHPDFFPFPLGPDRERWQFYSDIYQADFKTIIQFCEQFPRSFHCALVTSSIGYVQMVLTRREVFNDNDFLEKGKTAVSKPREGFQIEGKFSSNSRESLETIVAKLDGKPRPVKVTSALI